MAVKLSSRQLAQLAYLESLPPRFGRIYAVIEEMAGLRADDVVVRGLARLLDQIKAEAGAPEPDGPGGDRRDHEHHDPAGRRAADEGAGTAGAAGQPQDQLRGGDAVARRPSPARAAGAGVELSSGPRAAPAGEQALDERPAHEDDHGVDEDAHERRHERQRAQDERGPDRGQQDSEPVQSRVSGAGVGRAVGYPARPDSATRFTHSKDITAMRVSVGLRICCSFPPCSSRSGAAPLAAQESGHRPYEHGDHADPVAGRRHASRPAGRSAPTRTPGSPT